MSRLDTAAGCINIVQSGSQKVSLMVKSRTVAAACAIILFGLASASVAHERENRIVLNGQLNTADFDGGVGDRFGDSGGAYGYAVSYGSAAAFSGSAAFASAHAAAFAHASAFSHGAFHGGMHGGGHH
jgi:hypothetical protein